jgi:hypothetical protein
MSSRSPFVSPLDKRAEADAAKRAFAAEQSDHLAALAAYKAWDDARRQVGLLHCWTVPGLCTCLGLVVAALLDKRTVSDVAKRASAAEQSRHLAALEAYKAWDARRQAKQARYSKCLSRLE